MDHIRDLSDCLDCREELLLTCLLYTSDAADEMRGCLVGSEMCIRDSHKNASWEPLGEGREWIIFVT